jgi:integrase
MPRPTPPKHPVEGFLEEYSPDVGTSTRKKYAAIIRRMERSGEAPLAWLQGQVERLIYKKSRAAESTKGVLRAAIHHLLRYKHFEETGEVLSLDESHLMFFAERVELPKGVPGEGREALTRAQYEVYELAVQELPVVPQIRAVLQILPLTGLRISEACGLKRESIVIRGAEVKLEVVGKGGKLRVVPLSEDAIKVLAPFWGIAQAGAYIFTNPCLGLPGSVRPDLSPAQVRAVVRESLQVIPELEDLVPHVLRHHFASAAVKQNISPFTVKEILGHADLKTLEKYAHTDEDAMRDAVNIIAEALDSRSRKEETATERRRRVLSSQEGE